MLFESRGRRSASGRNGEFTHRGGMMRYCMRGRESMSRTGGSANGGGIALGVGRQQKASGGDAFTGNTRTHPEHDC